jgi:hypothetical protein
MIRYYIWLSGTIIQWCVGYFYSSDQITAIPQYGRQNAPMVISFWLSVSDLHVPGQTI